jgi:2-oxoglutarate dehydrogenase E2 component (dihydrolipoamide succinyltransferase)
MAGMEITVPSAGESITEVQIGEWRKSVGQRVEPDEIVVEIETDKASMELPAPTGGVLAAILKQAGQTARVGEVIAYIEPGADGDRPAPVRAAAAAGARQPTAVSPSVVTPGGEPRVMPAARRLLEEHGLGARQVTPTGPGGRLLKEDVIRHLAERGAAPTAAEGAPQATAPSASVPPTPAPPPGPRTEEAVPMTLLRRRIAERLVEAQHNAALLTTFNEIDMSAVLELRRQHGEAFQKKYGVKLGIMSLFVKAAIDALKQFPQVNAEIRNLEGPDGRVVPHIVYRNYYDIGVAVSTDHGLVVPVLRNAERMSLAEVELAIADLATRARERKLTVEELSGGTFTISNGGVFGSLMSTPIVNPPQSGILGLHAIQERPVARQGQVVIRPMMYVALTYDHRIIDGRESVTFLRRIKECIEDPARMLLEI